MKFLMIAAAAALATASPVAAQTNENFTGIRAEVTAGFNDITGVPDANDVNYGAAVGFDAPVGDRFTVGLEANTSNAFEDTRQIGAAARVGYAFNKNLLGYVKGGYNNYRDVFSRELDGAVVGAGLEVAMSETSFIKAQYDYSDFAQGAGSHSGLVGIGLRF